MFPVDATFLWVDGSDPVHQQLRLATAKRLGVDASSDILATRRFANHGELKYALRSLEMYAPWIRTIHIITNGQVPSWLDLDHPKIQLVTHEQIFPDTSALPTFNSHAIDLYLDRVPNLAEHFLAFNDDCLLGRPATPTTFFTEDGKARVFFRMDKWVRGLRQPKPSFMAYSKINSNKCLDKTFGEACRRMPIHQARPLLKSACQQCRQQYTVEYATAARNQFRSETDLAFMLYLSSQYMWHIGQAVPGTITHRKTAVRDDADETRANLESVFSTMPALFCINDETINEARQSWELYHQYMQQHFSSPCSFERQSTVVCN